MNARHLVSGTNAEVKLGPEVARNLAVYSDGTILVALGTEKRPDIRAAIYGAKQVLKSKRPEFQDTEPTLVTPEEITAAYQGTGKVRATQKNERLVADLVNLGAALHANDIHLWQLRTSGRIRLGISNRLTPVIKTMSREDMGELQRTIHSLQTIKRDDLDAQRFQKGQISVTAGNELGIDDRLSSIRVQQNVEAKGRHLCLRLHFRDPGVDLSDFRAQGFSDGEIELLDHLATQPDGGIILTGPTNSAKTTVGYALMEKRRTGNDNEDHIITQEDPPDTEHDWYTQLVVPDTGDIESEEESWEITQKATLRSQPTVLFIGEIRSARSATTFIRSAATGLLTLATCHTRSAMVLPMRLNEYDISIARMRQTIIGMIGLRLLPKLCDCALPLKSMAPRDPQAAIILQQLMHAPGFNTAQMGNVRVRNPAGCDRCQPPAAAQAFANEMRRQDPTFSFPVGSKGATVCSEIIVPDDTFWDHLATENPHLAQKHWLDKLGGQTLLMSALRKVAQGQISPVDVIKRIGALSPGEAHRKALAANIVGAA